MAKSDIDRKAKPQFIQLIGKLKIQIARRKRMHFGRSPEKPATEIARLELARKELATAQAGLPPRAASIARARKAPDRSLPPHLPRAEIVHPPARGDCVCPARGGALRRLERVPVKWNHLIDKDQIKIKQLEHAGIEKAGHLFRDMRSARTPVKRSISSPPSSRPCAIFE